MNCLIVRLGGKGVMSECYYACINGNREWFGG